MAKKAEATIALPPVNQIGIVVQDAAKTAEYYAATLGIGPFVFHDMNLVRAMLHGEPAPSRLIMALARMGPLEIELIQVLAGGEFYSEFLRNRGEGLHHLGSYMADLDSYDKMLAELENQGIKPTFQYRGRSLRFTYLDTRTVGGVIFELIHLEGRA